MRKWVGYILVLMAACAFGTASVIIKFTYSTGLAPIPVLIMQNFIAVPLAWLWVLFRRKRSVALNLLPGLFLQGTVGGFCTAVLFFLALDMLGASLGTLVFFTYPAFVVAYNVFWCRDKLSALQGGALVLSFIGLLLSVNIGHIKLTAEDIVPIFIGIGSAIANSFITIHGERMLKKTTTPLLTAWAYTFSTLALLAVYQPWWMLGMKLTLYQHMLVLTGAVLSLAPVALFYAGISRIGAGNAAILCTAEIPFTLLLAWGVLGESMTGVQIVGSVLITLSVLMLSVQRQ